MWIIIEGPDGAGKTTLASRLTAAANELGINPVTRHLGPPEPGRAVQDCLDVLVDLDDGASVISDRHHFGCPVYGPIYRPDQNLNGYGDMGKHGWRYTDLVASGRGALVVYCQATVPELEKRLEARGDDYIDAAHLPEIVRLYEWIIPQTTCGLNIVNAVTITDAEVRMLVLQAWAMRQLAKAAHAVFNAPIAGNPMSAKAAVAVKLLDDPIDAVAALGNGLWNERLLVRGLDWVDVQERFAAWQDARLRLKGH